LVWHDVQELGWGLATLLQDLHKKYSYIRKTRPDGNCFYRAFGFSHLEALLDDSKELQR
jgi:ubiquitin thioesterase protein OTUB1